MEMRLKKLVYSSSHHFTSPLCQTREERKGREGEEVSIINSLSFHSFVSISVSAAI